MQFQCVLCVPFSHRSFMFIKIAKRKKCHSRKLCVQQTEMPLIENKTTKNNNNTNFGNGRGKTGFFFATNFWRAPNFDFHALFTNIFPLLAQKCLLLKWKSNFIKKAILIVAQAGWLAPKALNIWAKLFFAKRIDEKQLGQEEN